MLPGCVAQAMQEIGRQVERPGDTLHGLDNNGRNVRADHRLGRSTVIARDEFDFEGLLRKAVPPVGIPCHSAGRGGAAVEAVGNREHLAPLRYRAGHAQCILVGFGARIDEKHSLEGRRRNGYEFFGGLRANFQRNGVALK